MQSGTRLILLGCRIPLALPSRTLGGGGFVNRFGERERARSARHAPDGLKTFCAHMKTTELKRVWNLVEAGEERPLSAAVLALLLRIRYALQESEIKQAAGRLSSLKLVPRCGQESYA
jgi:hypothetical protein